MDKLFGALIIFKVFISIKAERFSDTTTFFPRAINGLGPLSSITFAIFGGIISAVHMAGILAPTVIYDQFISAAGFIIQPCDKFFRLPFL